MLNFQFFFFPAEDLGEIHVYVAYKVGTDLKEGVLGAGNGQTERRRYPRQPQASRQTRGPSTRRVALYSYFFQYL